MRKIHSVIYHFSSFRDYNKLGSLPWTMNHIKLCYILESPCSHMRADQTTESYCQRRKEALQISWFHLGACDQLSVLWLPKNSSFHFKKSVSNFTVHREQHNPMVPLNPKRFKRLSPRMQHLTLYGIKISFHCTLGLKSFIIGFPALWKIYLPKKLMFWNIKSTSGFWKLI